MSQKINKKERESDENIEEILVYVDMDPASLSEQQIQDAISFKIVGNEKKVLMQVNNKFFEGELDFAMGTNVFFKKDETATPDPLYSHSNSLYKFVAKTDKVLSMNRVILKDQQRHTEEDDVEMEEAKGQAKSRTYQAALNLFLPPGKNPPRLITPEEELRQRVKVDENSTSIAPFSSESSTESKLE